MKPDEQEGPTDPGASKPRLQELLGRGRLGRGLNAMNGIALAILALALLAGLFNHH